MVADENIPSNRTQYFINALNSLSAYQNDSFYNESVSCFFEQLNASKVLMIKEPLEALDQCKDASCYNDVDIEMELSVDEIDEQMKKCLDHAKATGPLYVELLKVIEYCNARSKETLDELIEKLKSDNSEEIRNFLHQIIEIEHKSENDGNVLHSENPNIDEFVIELLT